eukprot:snap_masked-scaffold_8-processed-gene-7.34-mRNA-1 protein AED:1.00 eAED:1.00 QI:0/-1/0/0/-1/1/1/0/68
MVNVILVFTKHLFLNLAEVSIGVASYLTAELANRVTDVDDSSSRILKLVDKHSSRKKEEQFHTNELVL